MSNITPFEREQCLRIIDKLIAKDYCREFVKLDLSGSDTWIKEYRRRISTPMDLQMIRTGLQNNSYLSLNDFALKVDLVWTNAIEFNLDGSPFAALAREGQAKFQRSFAKMGKTREELWARKLIKTARTLKEAGVRLAKQVARDARRTTDSTATTDGQKK